MSTTAVSLKQRPKLAFLCEHVRTVKWFQLGIQLEVDTVSLKEIHQEYSDVNEKRTKMYDEWLRTKPEASLVQLINALRSYAVQEHTIAYNLEQIYNRNKPAKEVELGVLRSSVKGADLIRASSICLVKERKDIERPSVLNFSQRIYTPNGTIGYIQSVVIGLLGIILQLMYNSQILLLVFIISLSALVFLIFQLTNHNWGISKSHDFKHPSTYQAFSLTVKPLSSLNVIAVNEDITANIILNQLSENEKFRLFVTVSNTPLPLNVDLYEKGRELKPLTCYLTASVIRQSSSQLTTRKKSYNIQIQKNSGKGKAVVEFCFYQPNKEYTVSVKIHSILNERGEEIITSFPQSDAYSIVTYTYYPASLNGTELSRLKSTSPLKGKKYLKFTERFHKVCISGNLQSVNDINNESTIPTDFKVLANVYFGTSYFLNKHFRSRQDWSHAEVMEAFSSALRFSKQPCCRNSCLLQGIVYTHISQQHRRAGNVREAWDNIQKAKSQLFNVELSNETGVVFYQEAMIHLAEKQFTLSEEMKEKIIFLLETAAYHQQCKRDSRSVCNLSYTLVVKALIHLNNPFPWLEHAKPEEIHCPQLKDTDIENARKSLKSVSKDSLQNSEPSRHKAAYYFALSEYYKAIGNSKLAIKYMKYVKQQVLFGNFYFYLEKDAIDRRLKQLKSQNDSADDYSDLDSDDSLDIY